MRTFLSWLSTKSLAHLFAITRHLERENSSLRQRIATLESENTALRQETLQKIFLAVGLSHQEPQLALDGVPLEAFQVKATNPVSELVRRAEEEDWVKWQEEERRRLAAAQLNSLDFHNLDA